MGVSKYFESGFFNTLFQAKTAWIDHEYVGLVSYRIIIKQNLRTFPLEKIIKSGENADVITFYKVEPFDMLSQSISCHPKFEKLWSALLLKLGFTKKQALSRRIPLFQSNCWMAKPSWMLRYIDLAMRAMKIMETDPVIHQLVYSNSHYEGKMSRVELMKMHGKPFYTYHPFIMERLPCFFFWVHGAKVYSTSVDGSAAFSSYCFHATLQKQIKEISDVNQALAVAHANAIMAIETRITRSEEIAASAERAYAASNAGLLRERERANAESNARVAAENLVQQLQNRIKQLWALPALLPLPHTATPVSVAGVVTATDAPAGRWSGTECEPAGGPCFLNPATYCPAYQRPNQFWYLVPAWAAAQTLLDVKGGVPLDYVKSFYSYTAGSCYWKEANALYVRIYKARNDFICGNMDVKASVMLVMGGGHYN